MAVPYKSRGRSCQAVPLDRDSSGRYLPLLVAIMVYLAALALAGGLAMNKLAARWDSGLAGALTVQLPAEVADDATRSEEHTSELQSLMRISYAVFCLKKKKNT